jgi:outer membrane immunogenic protein
MKKLLGATAALAFVAMAVPANAADIPVKAPPIVMPALYNWNGLYIGIEAGAVMGQRTDFSFLNVPIVVFSPPLPTLCSSPPSIASVGPGLCANVGHPLHGGFLGGEAGFNWQPVGSRWVFGIEGDGNWAQLEGALTCAVPFQGISCGARIRDFETVRARIGYAFGPTGSFLVFVTGGWATASVGANESLLRPPFTSFTDWHRRNGFAVGGGAEYGITSWLSVKAEVLYVGLEGGNYCFDQFNVGQAVGFVGHCTTTVAATSALLIPAHVKTDFIAARMGLNWRFNWGKGKGPGPVVARY